MTLDVGTAVEEAVDRVATPAGALLVVLFAVLGVVKTAAVNDASRPVLEEVAAWFEAQGQGEAASELRGGFEQGMGDALSLGLDPWPALALWLGCAAVSVVLLAVAIDAFLRDVDEPAALGTDRFGWKAANLLAGWVAYPIVLFAGFLVSVGVALQGSALAAVGGLGVLLSIPLAIGLAVALLYWPVAVVRDGEWFGAAFATSARVVVDNVAETLVLIALLIGVSVLQSLLWRVTGAVFVGAPLTVANEAVDAALWVLTWALIANGYAALTRGAPAGGVVGDREATGRDAV